MMSTTCVIFLSGLLRFCHCLVAPVTKGNGQPNIDTINTEITLLIDHMKTVAAIQTTTAAEVQLLKSQLNLTRTEFTALKSEYTATKTELAIIKDELNNTTMELSSVKSQLTASKAEVATVKAQWKDTAAKYTELVMLKDELHNTTREVSRVNSQLTIFKAEIDTVNVQLQDVTTKVTDLAISKVELNDTTRELSSFKTQIYASNKELATVKASLKNTSTTLTTVMSQLGMERTKLAGVKTELQVQQSSVSSNKQMMLDIQAQMNVYETNQTIVRGVIDSLQEDVSFVAGISHHLTNVTDGETLIFDKVRYNLGGGYDPQSGIFIAPVAGTYLIWAHIHVRVTNSSLHVTVHQNTKLIGSGTIYTENHAYQAAEVITTQALRTGDKVTFRKKAGTIHIGGGGYGSSYGVSLQHAH